MTSNTSIPREVLGSYGLEDANFTVTPITSGHINFTAKIEDGARAYILQSINPHVFPNASAIAKNIALAESHIKRKNLSYPFTDIIKTTSGDLLSIDTNGTSWRLMRYIKNTITKNSIASSDDAYRAAHAFGTFTELLSDAHPESFEVIIPRFHDLTFRLEQFDQALLQAQPERVKEAEYEIAHYNSARSIAKEFDQLASKNILKKRVHHHDTKINNVLFDATTDETVCVIDLDTLMPGYFISDIGDMIRTFVSVYENERDLTKVVVRDDVYHALTEGYRDSMGNVLSEDELSHIPFAGRYMTYMLGLRMLTDYLNNDAYFRVEYATQNLDRAKNQLRLYELLTARA